MNTAIGPIDPAEVKLLEFNFGADLNSASVQDVAIECLAASGQDAAAPTRCIGLPVLTAATVVQRIGTCLAGVTYRVRCVATDTAGLVHVQTAILACARL